MSLWVYNWMSYEVSFRPRQDSGMTSTSASILRYWIHHTSLPWVLTCLKTFFMWKMTRIISCQYLSYNLLTSEDTIFCAGWSVLSMPLLVIAFSVLVHKIMTGILHFFSIRRSFLTMMGKSGRFVISSSQQQLIILYL